MTQTLELNADGEVRGAPPDPMLGRKLLHYRVIETIGQGGMSVVYRGVDEHLGRDVAIKVLHPFLAEKPECRTRLAREARAVARLEHPHIVKVFDFSGDAPTLDQRPGGRRFDHEGFIVCELVRGPTLKRFCEKQALWHVPEVGALVIWQLLQALQHAHDNGIVHRDLKPENVMVRDDGCLKLMDFGIAHIADQGGLTVTGTLLGSPAHMAPECIDGHAADERSDVFSMGTVLYWITTGSLPFEALTPHALLKQIVDGRAVPAQQKSARVSDDLARVIAKAIATDPAQRYQSAAEFAVALADVVERAGLVVDSEALRKLLDDPRAGLASAGATVRTTSLARAERELEAGQTARALAGLNRVLAVDPADVDARALLDRLHDDDDSATDVGDAVDADDKPTADVVDAGGAAVADGALISTTPGLRIESRRTAPTASPAGVRWQSLLVGATAIVLIALAVVVARAIDAAVSTDAVAAGDAADTDSTPRARPSGTTTTTTKVLPRLDRGLDRSLERNAKLADRLPRPRLDVPRVERPVITASPARGAVHDVEHGPTQTVTFRVKPWA
ncbi:MAG TPA: serine/threonine-protein kinase, partial [Myxococcota bacterium]